MITGGFFVKYYVAGSMRLRESDELDQVQMTLEDADALIKNLYESCKMILDIDSTVLSDNHKSYLLNTCLQLQKSTSKSINNNKLEKSASFNASQQKLSENNSSLKVVTTESKILGRYGDFITSLESDDNLKTKVLREAMGFIKSIQALPFKSGFLFI